ncbi:outer membrane beta-barrel protein [Thalassotalea atypica]|uniref:outer membrane beta-barrel protein n=1 Tax=Thalassotalea atypica TaxID=2054316 RepID=UPI00257317E7|nr:outer membrane beta-barrel protein [Thalassotalea atypica]
MRFTTSAVLLTLCVAHAGNASSFNEDERDDQSIPIAGGMLLTPFLNIQQRYDSNVASTNIEDINSWLTIFQPNVKLTREFGEFGKHNFEIDWIFTHGAYHAAQDDSYNDHDISGKLNYEINQRHRLMFQGGYIDSHEERGSRFSIGTGGLLEEPDTYEQIYGGVQYTFGALEADMRLEVEVGYFDNDYRSVFTESIVTGEPFDSTAARDRTTEEFGGTFYYKIGAATDLTIEAWSTEYDYDYTPTPAEELSSNESRVFVGAKWEATALTTGFAKVGYKEKEFDNPLFENFYNVEWEAEIDWAPKTYSHFTFKTGRRIEETNGEGFFIESAIGNGYVINSTQHSADWRHEWRDRISSEVVYAENKDVYTGLTGKIREDNNTSVKLALYYDMSYWVSFSLAYDYIDRDSTRELLNYDRELVTLGVRLALY